MMTNRLHILLPANSLFIVLTITAALIWSILPWGQVMGLPDLLLLVLLFWNIYQARKVALGTSFFLGIVLDVQHGFLLGEHALAYVITSYCAIFLARRILSFNIILQTLHIFLLLLLSNAVFLTIHWFSGRFLPETSYFAASIVGALLWPFLSFLLLAPQGRAHDHDDTRPL